MVGGGIGLLNVSAGGIMSPCVYDDMLTCMMEFVIFGKLIYNQVYYR